MTQFVEFPVRSPFIDALGLKLVRADNGVSEVMLSLEPMHTNTWGVAHGGLTMTLLDVALSLAARSAGEPSGVVTVELNTSFMQPGRGELRAHGRVMHQSSTMAFCEGEVRDASGAFVAKALGTFKYLRKLAVGRTIVEQAEPGGDAP
ncbi:PaaI family thioesterase [Pararobbsia silviterrae]|uniref:PaaI family thioesterase n=1 Tax=Pararobbsia silviterrae TaxID=1792498 RepID=A0A494Y0C1_9BURK|nr:PaaI family thioesterase [Pararobbsia silviterrae]RKP54759.1 PaaI family thioesterase [Pararobbsia silviterrae]